MDLVLAVLAVVVLGLIILGVVVVIEKGVGAARSRRCPQCGHRVRTGLMDCTACGYDFRQ